MSASEASREDRQLPATQRRIQQAREQGQVARSRELVHCAAALSLLALLASLGPWLAQQGLDLVSTGLRFDRNQAFEVRTLVPRLSLFSLHGLAAVLPVATGLAVLLAGAAIAVGGWNFTSQALTPKLERLNPLSGFTRLFGWRHQLENMRLAFISAALLGGAGFYIKENAATIDMLARLPLGDALTSGFGWLAGGLGVIAGVCLVSALIDVPMQLFKHRAELRMTLQEAKQEHKESEGDPHVKGERRRRARELSRGRMLAEVPLASVVVTNPTHYAVALRYDEDSMAAPRIVAMGTDLLALKIREVATAARVPVLEAPPLARALYKHGEVGGEVPVALYTAVAQVLAWVYRLRTALRPPPPPQVEVPPGLDPKEAAA